jgi:transcriptional regulator with XRE-family HTH domain
VRRGVLAPGGRLRKEGDAAMGTLGDELAKVLFRKRRAFRFTQADLGSRIGVSGSYISSLESAKASPRISELEDMAAHFRSTAIEMILEASRADQSFVAMRPTETPGLGLDALAEDLTEDQRAFAREFLLFLRERGRVDAAERRA